ncbi:acyl-CoA synthetase [Microbacterium amylolyticum]|uniref:Acyl-CoA synthetase n=1 Tax=Microbacterium amylolyticum TaxID=936337 RepID=A0ABS4ZI79_9MICO|nr:acyl-CoA synthetase [Microbacterium amylolyticum]MBP2436975.1 hypothetical protein [Microbacterium amylolyticum]
MPARSVTPRDARVVLVLRALIVAVAALTATFVQERTGEFSLLLFQVFAGAMAILLWGFVAYRRGNVDRIYGILGAVHALALIAGFLPWGDAATRFHWVLIAWAVVAGSAELMSGRRARDIGEQERRDRLVVGALTLLLAVVSLVVSPQYSLDYFIEDAGRTFTLTGTIIGVGLFGGWAAIVAVYLGIGAASPAPVATHKDES